MKRLVLLLLFIPVFVMGQQTITGENILSIKNLGGLNTRSGDFSIKQNEFRRLDGVNLNLNLGSITKRWGYENLGTVAGQDSLIGIFGAYFSDGRQRLFYVGDSAGEKYGNIYATDFNVTSGQTRIVTEWPIINKPTFTIFRDKVYITNGSSRGIVYDNEISRPFPLYAPAEPKIVPLKVTANGNLNGEYVYVFKFRETAIDSPFTHYVAGEPSQKISVKNGQVLLKDFTWITGYSPDPTPDSIHIRIYRTKANPGNLDEGDTAFWVGTDIIATDTASLALLSFIDSVADGSLNADSFTSVITEIRTGFGVGNADARYGAPMYITDKDTLTGNGLWRGAPVNFWGYAYRQTILDTATLLESPLSPPLFLQAFINGADTSDLYRIGIPNPPLPQSGYKINLYRALVMYDSWDTTWYNVPADKNNIIIENILSNMTKCVTLPDRSLNCYLSSQPRYEPGSNKDSIYVDNYFLLSQLDAGDTIFTDTFPHDSIALASFDNLYSPSVPPTPLNGMITANDRLFGFRGENVYFSNLDSASRWFLFNWITINAQDGDRINAMFQQRDAIRIGKTKALYNFYQDGSLQWSLSEISQHFGIVSQHSIASGIGGTYYYTDFGVVRETEGQFRDRRFNTELISTNITALDSIPVAIKESAIGFYHKQMYMLSLPYDSTAGDSGLTYVYFEKANAWARWPNLSFGGATLYSTETALSFLPPDTMYFFKAGQSVIYRLGDFEKDNTDGAAFPIQIRATSAPLFTDDMNLYKRVNRVGIVAGATTEDTLVVRFQDEEGSQKSPDIEFLDLRTKYQVSAAADSTFGRYLQYILTNLSGSWATNTRIEGIELFYQLEGQNDDN